MIPGQKQSIFTLLVLCLFASGLRAAEIGIVRPTDAGFLTRLAAKELRRYLYLRTGRPAQITEEPAADGAAVILGVKADSSLLAKLPEATRVQIAALGASEYVIETTGQGGARRVWIIGGDDLGLLYGSYRFCELMGVRFYLHGDVIPDERRTIQLPDVKEIGKPLFNIRGIQPFHDFPEGPDWWNQDDYLVYACQLAKMRMNFLGLHCYPEGGPHAEPAVWIGLREDHDNQGNVHFSYPSMWANTQRDGHWGYAPFPTSQFSGGASQLFAEDQYGPDVMAGLMPQPSTGRQSDELFNRTGAMLREVFTFARALGIKTCVGTEIPLTTPALVNDHLRKLGKSPEDPNVIRELYEGIFSRIKQSYPLDYYWFWTPEGWTWEGNRPEQFEATVQDIRSALAALESLGNPFTLATSGWVLGPAHDRTALDKLLPKTIPMSCINREVGHDVVEPGFGSLEGRPKWAIPWMENDPNLISPQPWVGRMRYDAVDARSLGCTGLLGIHWRTKILAPNVSALASAAWDQSYAPAQWRVAPPARAKGPIGGKPSFSNDPVSGTDQSFIYQSVQTNLDGYELDVPNGTYTIVLEFVEPVFGRPNERVFGIRVQAKTVRSEFDIVKQAGGRNRAFDLPIPDCQVAEGLLRVDFTRLTGDPCIAGITIEGRTEAGQQFARKVNCGGDSVGDYERDGSNDKPGTVERRRTMPVEDFYVDFARANFGESVARSAGLLFARIDGLNLPQASHWEAGPGGINPVKVDPAVYRFVDELESVQRQVKGSGNQARFAYWLDTYRYMRAMAQVGSLRAQLDGLVGELERKTESGTRKKLAMKAITVRVRMARAWEKMMGYLVAATDTPGELGTIANLEQHNRVRLNFLGAYDAILTEANGGKLPAEVAISKDYSGLARLIVPTVRSQARPGERVSLRMIAIDREPVHDVRLYWRPLGQGQFRSQPASHVGRAVFQASLPAADEDIEYYLTARTASGQDLVWPPTAPDLCETVLVLP